MRHIIFSLALLLLVTACEGTKVTHIRVRHGTMHSMFTYAAAGQHLLVQIQGDPFGLGEKATAQRVLKATPTPSRLAATTYTLNPAEAEHPNFQLKIGLNPDRSQSFENACEEGIRTQAGREGTEITVLGIFCGRGGPYTRAVAQRSKVTSLDDPAFAETMDRLITALFPIDRSARMGRNCKANTIC